MSDWKAPAQVPVMPARRTLLIGLGTTGASVCGQILEQLAWSHGGMDNIPWVKCVILETMELNQALKQLNRSARVIQLRIDRQQYAGLITNPAQYDQQIAFASWNNPELTGTQDAIVHGANNVRMLGRLAFLFPPNFNAATGAIRGALADLQSLDEKEASECFSRGQPQPVPVQLSPNIQVYVTGTLCGGTSSGSFLDLGYVLQSLDGYEKSLNTDGIFLLPSGAHRNNKHCANAYAALLELNHYSSRRSRYEQQYPDRPGSPRRFPPGTSPYRYCYLIQARGEADVEYARLVTAAADYISADLIGDKTNARDGKRTNIADFFSHTDVWGATQKFFSFGIGTIEFPYVKVAKACALRLSGLGFRSVAGGEAITPTRLNDLIRENPALRFEGLAPRLLALPTGNLGALIGRALEGIRSQAEHAEGPLQQVRAQIELAFGSKGSVGAHPDLSPGLVPRTIDDNARQLGAELHRTMEALFLRFLTTPAEGGLQSLSSCLSALETTLEAGIKECDTAPKQAMGDALTRANEAEENAQACRTDPFLAITWGRSQAVRRYIDQCLQECKRHYQLKLREACAPEAKRIYNEMLTFVRTVQRRVDNTDCGMKQEVNTIVARMGEMFHETNIAYGARMDGTSRVINGVELFDPATTVEQEYQRCVRRTAVQRQMPGDFESWQNALAREATLKYIEGAARALFADPHEQFRFDSDGFRKTPEFDENQIMDFAEPARSGFRPLNDVSLMSRLMQLQTRDTELVKANQAAELLISWQPGNPRHRDYANTNYKFVFINDEDPLASDFRQWIRQNNILPDVQDIRYMTDQHQMMILHERGAFSLGTLRELDDNYDSKWRSDFSDPTIPSFQSRNDIREWVGWGRKDEEARSRLRNLFLVGVAIDIIKSLGAQRYRFCYPPLDWADTGSLDVSNDLDAACQALKFKSLEGELSTQIATYRHENGATDVFFKLDSLVKRSDLLFTETDKSLSQEEVSTYLLDYIMEDTELSAEFQEKYPNRAELRLIGADKDGKRAFVCPCDKKHLLGYHASDLYVTTTKQGITTREFQCSLCKKDFHTVMPNTARPQ